MKNRMVALAMVGVGAWGCGPMPEGEEAFETVEQAAMLDSNGLEAVNGLSMMNGLAMMNGLSMMNGLAMMNGLSDSVGLMASAPGRKTVSYMVRCALPNGRSITKKDNTGASHTFQGKLGLAPQWEYGACDGACQEWISSCLLAHINTTGQNIPIYMVAQDTVIKGGRDVSYPNFEGAFFGNIFSSPPRAYYCRGRDSDVNIVPGRIGDHNRNSEPYQNPWGQHSYCANHCSGHNSNEGTFSNCNGFGRVISTWRQAYAGSYGAVVAPTYDFEGTNHNWQVRAPSTAAAPTAGATGTSTAQKYKGNSSLVATINGGAGDYFIGVQHPAVSNMANKTVVMTIWYPSNMPLTGLQPFVQEDGSKGWRYTGNWAFKDWTRPGQWNTVSVRVPSDAGGIYMIGAQFRIGAGWNGQVHIDMVTF